MHFKPGEGHKYLRGVDHPASGEQLASTAESNGAPGGLVERLRNLGDEEFSGPGQAMAALKRS